jgi:chemotaxis protein CheD
MSSRRFTSRREEEENVKIIVGVSDAKVSSDTADVLATYSLGSCIGVSLYDSTVKVAGLLHFQLPSASMDAERAKANPLMFADSGLQHLLSAMEAAGAQKRRLKVKLAGAAQMLNDANVFNIGKRNHAAIRKVLWQHGMFVDSESIGGKTPRTLYVSVADGTVLLKCGGESTEL